MALVDIIVPAYNAETYLAECLDSVLAQTMPDWRCIIVDDASTDATEALARRYAAADSRFVVARLPHVGVSMARNHGLDLSEAEFITFLDADDMLRPDALSVLLDMMYMRDDVDVAVAQYYTDAPRAVPADVSFYSSFEAVYHTLYQHPLFHTSVWAKMFRRSTLDCIEFPFTPGRKYEDLEATPRFYRRVRVLAVTRQQIYFYRQNPGSFLHSWSPSRMDALWAAENILSYVRVAFPRATKAAYARLYSANYNVLGLAAKAGEMPLARECYEHVRRFRMDMLRDPEVRLKNKIGALLTFLGRRATFAVAKRMY